MPGHNCSNSPHRPNPCCPHTRVRMGQADALMDRAGQREPAGWDSSAGAVLQRGVALPPPSFPPRCTFAASSAGRAAGLGQAPDPA